MTSADCEIFEVADRPGIRVSGRSRREVTARALRGLAQLQRPDHLQTKKPHLEVRVRVTGRTFEETLGRFLSHVIFESGYHQAVFPAAHFIHLDAYEIEAVLLGVSCDHVEFEAGDIATSKLRREQGIIFAELTCRP